jgi:tetratricopeptide (TPR) repeat protein
LAQPGADPVAGYGLGNYLYDLRRHDEAIDCWQRAVADGACFATVFRNLGIGVWNRQHDGHAARNHYLNAMAMDPADPRLISEYDQLCAKLNDPPAARLEFLEGHLDLVLQRDDCTVALAALYNLTAQPQQALDIILARRFHPWEGGEGAVLRQFTTAHLQLGRKALDAGDAETALRHFTGAMDTPDSLGEKYHLLQAKADVNYWIGRAFKALGHDDEARRHFEESATEQGDFTEMAVTSHSPLSWFRGMSLRELGRHEEADVFFRDLLQFAEAGIGRPARIDYFATSLPNLLVFDEDLQARRDASYRLLAALAHHGLGDSARAMSLAEEVLAFDQADQHARDLRGICAG